MGIPGLTTFIDENNHVLRDLELHDTRVIVDGNNLYHFLYYYFKIPAQYGGDYPQFEKKVRYFFQTFKTCAIQPVVIFDGALDEEGRKLSTGLKRAKNRLQVAESISAGRGGRILPILAYETFRQVLNDCEIPHVTCDYEADSEIAALANHWECPVMTNDSDFFVYDLKGGYIVLDYLNLEICKKETDDQNPRKFLKVQIYFLDTFLAQLGKVDRKLIPLFATLMGNDFVESKSFEVFFCGVKFAKPSSDKLFASKRFTKMASLLLWLAHMETFDNALSKVLEYFPTEQRPLTKKIINRCVDSYLNLSTNIASYFERSANAYEPSSDLKSFTGVAVPSFFISLLRNGEVSVLLTNALIHRKVLFLAQVEKMTEISSYQSGKPIRAAIYAILLSLDRESDSDLWSVSEYDRVLRNLKCTQVTSEDIPAALSQPTMADIPDLSKEQRCSVILQVLDIEDSSIESVPDDIKLVWLTAMFWVKTTRPRLRSYHLMAVVLSLLNFWPLKQLLQTEQAGICSEETESTNSSDSTFLQSVSASCTKPDLERASLLLRHLSSVPRHGKTSFFDSSFVHPYAQFQTCYLAILHLNQVLESPFHSLSPARFFNGTFFYNLTKEMKSRKSSENYLAQLLSSAPTVLQCFHDFYSRMCAALPPDVFLGKKKKKKTSKSKETESKTEDMDEDKDEDKETAELQAACDLNNRFTCLDLD